MITSAAQWDDYSWPNFSPSEFVCSCCGELKIDPLLLDTLQHIRNTVKSPLIITSGYRCPKYNAKISSTGENGPHTTGKAVDISCRGSLAFAVISAAMDEKIITGLGVSQKGSTRFIHLDMIKGAGRPWVWSY